MICALIMAGGKGTRFWPLSTEENPKQFLNLIGDKTMIQVTIERIKDIIPMERIFVCTGKLYFDLVKKQLPDLPEENIILEPEGRNTTPCITLASLIIRRRYKDSNMLVLPSDHLIEKEEEFRKIVQSADKFLLEKKEAIVTIGIKPNRIETGYGYIKCSSEKITRDFDFVKVDKFVEKPNEENAKRYIEEGNYLWNAGMFLWNINNILENIKKYSPTTYEVLQGIKNVPDEGIQEFIDANYKKTENISIDYSVLEKSENIYVVPSDINWDDVGSWEALERYRERDEAGNILMGKGKVIDSYNNLIVSANNNILVNGISNIYVIENDGKIIIGNRSDVKQIKELKNLFKKVNHE